MRRDLLQLTVLYFEFYRQTVTSQNPENPSSLNCRRRLSNALKNFATEFMNLKDNNYKLQWILCALVAGAIFTTVVISVHIPVTAVSSTQSFKALLLGISVIKDGVLVFGLFASFVPFVDRQPVATSTTQQNKERVIKRLQKCCDAIIRPFRCRPTDTQNQGVNRRLCFHNALIVLFALGALVYFSATSVFHSNCFKCVDQSSAELVAAIFGLLLVISITLCTVWGQTRLSIDDFWDKFSVLIVGLSVSVIGASTWVDGVRMSSVDNATDNCDKRMCSVARLVKYYSYPVVIQFTFLVLASLRKLWKGDRDSDSKSAKVNGQPSPVDDNSTRQKCSTCGRVSCGAYVVVVAILVLFYGCAGVRSNVEAIRNSASITDLETSVKPDFLPDLGTSSRSKSSNHSSLDDAVLQHLGAHFGLLLLGLFHCFHCLYVIWTSGNDCFEQSTLDLDALLIILSAAAITAHSIFDIVADSVCTRDECGEHKQTYLPLDITQLLINIIQASLQSGILLQLKEMKL